MTFDPYTELDVPHDADEKAIRRAYRRRAKETHPDTANGDRGAFERANKGRENDRPRGHDWGSVEVSKVTKVASGIIFILSVLTIVVGALTGFHMIYPPMAAVIGLASAVFYYMGVVLERQWRK